MGEAVKKLLILRLMLLPLLLQFLLLLPLNCTLLITHIDQCFDV